jgi:two-component system chemotaxis sensor kinase CheA
MTVDNQELSAYLPLFIEESKEYIQQISDNLLRLEREARDAEAINEVFRAVHTLKGMAATMGYSEISQLAHEAENLLDEIRHNSIEISPAMITGFFHVVDEFENQVGHLVETGEPLPMPRQKIEEIRAFLSRPVREEVSPQEGEGEEIEGEEPDTPEGQDAPAEPSPPGAYKLEVFFTSDCLLPQARALIVCNQLASVGTLLSTNPSQEDLPDLAALDKLQCWVRDIRPDQVRALLEGGVEIDYYTIELAEDEESPPAADSPAQDPGAEVPDPADSRHEAQVFRPSIRVDTEKLDQLLNLVSELVINKTALQQGAAAYPPLTEGVEHLHRLTSELQSIVMKMRMIPLETVFNRFPRMIRDTAMSLNKLVNFEIEGAETELDRTIIDDIADPLVHLLRNAIDHGIEPVEQRLQKGKPRTGTVSLKAYQTGNQVIIEVSDDGRGLDLGHIQSKARELRLFTGLEADQAELQNLIFTPGFSTAENVTDLSGRGVGLDVVKNSIESLGGAIEVLSQPDAGAMFRISLPLTLAIIQGLLVKCGAEHYAVPLTYVEETGFFYSDEIRTIGQQEIIMLRGKVLPLVFLSKLLGAEEAEPGELSLVVVRYGQGQVGIVVDDLVAQQDIVIKNLNWGERFFRSFLGCSILGDGSVVMILDISVILSGLKLRGVINE